MPPHSTAKPRQALGQTGRHWPARGSAAHRSPVGGARGWAREEAGNVVQCGGTSAHPFWVHEEGAASTLWLTSWKYPNYPNSPPTAASAHPSHHGSGRRARQTIVGFPGPVQVQEPPLPRAKGVGAGRGLPRAALPEVCTAAAQSVSTKDKWTPPGHGLYGTLCHSSPLTCQAATSQGGGA